MLSAGSSGMVPSSGWYGGVSSSGNVQSYGTVGDGVYGIPGARAGGGRDVTSGEGTGGTLGVVGVLRGGISVTLSEGTSEDSGKELLLGKRLFSRDVAVSGKDVASGIWVPSGTSARVLIPGTSSGAALVFGGGTGEGLGLCSAGAFNVTYSKSFNVATLTAGVNSPIQEINPASSVPAEDQ